MFQLTFFLSVFLSFLADVSLVAGVDFSALSRSRFRSFPFSADDDDDELSWKQGGLTLQLRL